MVLRSSSVAMRVPVSAARRRWTHPVRRKEDRVEQIELRGNKGI